MNPKNEVDDLIRSRLADPFIGSFVIAFVVVHWEFVYSLINGEGKGSLTLPQATKHFNVYGPVSDICFVFTVALFYTFAWPWIAGYIRDARTWIEIQGRNRARRLEASKLHETSQTLLKRPEYVELTSRIEALRSEVQLLWSQAAGHQGLHNVVHFGVLTHPVPGLQLPHLFLKTPQGLRPHYGARGDGVVLGYVLIGTETLLFVEPGGAIPWRFSDRTADGCRFVEGKAVPISSPGDWSAYVPRIERKQDMGLFVG